MFESGKVKVSSAFLAAFLAVALVFAFTPLPARAGEAEGGLGAGSSAEALQAQASGVAGIVADMTMDEKVSQLIIPAMRAWDGTNVTDLSAAPALASALQAHQYGGVILYGSNISSTEQVTRLTSALQANNASISPAPSTKIPYLMCVDGEGGAVTRLTMGTRMNGNMAIAATGDAARENALATGQVIGEEVAVAGFNVDFAPDIDVNSNPANPVIGTRSFSDDPETVSALGAAFTEGLAKSNVVATYKHFPGHGDTDNDTHLDVATVNKTLDELKATELVPFADAIDAGADLIMTAHITLPLVDDQVTFADGTMGYYPATMSKKLLTDILRTDMGYDGVIVTDALEMGALHDSKAPLVEGDPGSAEYGANLAIKVIEAGTDILLLPTDLNSSTAATYYDDYISALMAYANSHAAFAARVDESVTRILTLKQKYGILDMDTSGSDVEQQVTKAEATIGSDEHHAIEAEIARQAITVVKNDEGALPLAGEEGNYVFVGRMKSDNVSIVSAIRHLKGTGAIAADAYVNNLAAGTTEGLADSKTKVTIDYYYDSSDTANPHYTDDLKAAVAEADAVVGFSTNWGLSTLQPANVQYRGLSSIIADAHDTGARFVLLSNNLPYDAARYQDADGIMLCYMNSGIDIDPTERATGSSAAGAYNANVKAAINSMFGVQPQGKLPVNIPAIEVAQDGKASYSTTDTLYERGTGLAYSAPVTVKAADAKVLAYSASAQTFSCPFTATNPNIAVAYTKTQGADYISVDEGTGKVTLAPGTPVGTYPVSVKIRAEGTAAYPVLDTTVIASFDVQVEKAANTLKVKRVKATFNAKSAKATKYKAAKVFKVAKNASGGRITYKLASLSKTAKGKISISKAGKLTVKKGLPRKTYTVKVKATSAATANYKAESVNVKFKVKVA